MAIAGRIIQWRAFAFMPTLSGAKGRHFRCNSGRSRLIESLCHRRSLRFAPLSVGIDWEP